MVEVKPVTFMNVQTPEGKAHRKCVKGKKNRVPGKFSVFDNHQYEL